MARTSHPSFTDYEPIRSYSARPVRWSQPLNWLKEGLDYFRATPRMSLAFGGLFALFGLAITIAGYNEPQFVFTFWSGFLLVGPVLAMLSYHMARRIDDGESGAITLAGCLNMLTRKLGTTLLFSVLMGALMIAWVRLSGVIANIFAASVDTSAGMLSLLATSEGIGMLIALLAVGGLFAALIFAIGAWSLPMLVDEKTDLSTALASSMKSILDQPVPMLLWGALVAALTIVGMATLFIGFAFIFPLLGYATWAGYRDLFDQQTL